MEKLSESHLKLMEFVQRLDFEISKEAELMKPTLGRVASLAPHIPGS
jgi:hypothetical protein